MLASSLSGVALRVTGAIVILLTISSFYFTYLNYQASDTVALYSPLAATSEDFSWMSYVDQNSGLARLTYTAAIKHFNQLVTHKGLHYLQVTPPVRETEIVQLKVEAYSKACSLSNRTLSAHNLVIYYVPETEADFQSMAKLNLLMFLTTIDQDDPCLSAAPTFYIFSIANGAKNALFQYIPSRSNVAVLSWHQKSPSEQMYNHLRTLEVITPRLLDKFGAVFLLSNDVRGPLTGRYQNEWMQKYRFLLDRNNVAVVSPVIYCTEYRPQVPKIHTYALAVRTEFILLVLEQFQVDQLKPTAGDTRYTNVLKQYFSLDANSLLYKKKYRSASIAQYMMDGHYTYYNNECSKSAKPVRKGKNVAVNQSIYAHHAWCHDISLRMFVPWSKTRLQSTEYNCPDYITSMYQYLAQFSTSYPNHTAQIESTIGSINIFETLYEDNARDVFLQYNEELRRLHLATNTTSSTNANVATGLSTVTLNGGNNAINTIDTSIVSEQNNSYTDANFTITVIPSIKEEGKNANFTHTHHVPYTHTNHYTDYVYNGTSTNSQVCFLVRTSTMHDRIEHKAKEIHYTEVDVFDFISSLQKQTNPNWCAYLFLTDDRPFTERLREIVMGARDSRVVYFDVDVTHRPKFTKVDGGYTATDYVLKHVLHDTTCKYISVTNGDNSYGSEVVQRVLEFTTTSYAPSTVYKSHNEIPRPTLEVENGSNITSINTSNATIANTTPTSVSTANTTGSITTHLRGAPASKATRVAPPMLLAPLDSRNFNIAYQYKLFKHLSHDEACRGLNALLEFNMLTYTTQPVPRVGRVDLASLFLNREAFLKANVVFANFTDPVEYPCLGCQDGYLAEHLTTKLSWEFARMPIDGLKSIVFHGPSPTLCVAAGNVWFDHPAVNQVGCYTRATVHALRVQDRSQHRSIYDWANYDENAGVCIRLSRYGLRTLPREENYKKSISSRLRSRNFFNNTLLSFLTGI